MTWVIEKHLVTLVNIMPTRDPCLTFMPLVFDRFIIVSPIQGIEMILSTYMRFTHQDYVIKVHKIVEGVPTC